MKYAYRIAGLGVRSELPLWEGYHADERPYVEALRRLHPNLDVTYVDSLMVGRFLRWFEGSRA